jgi:hypothetical protein
MRRVFTVLVLTALPLGAAQADVYRSVDAQGHVQYSDVPTPGSERVSDLEAASDPAAAEHDAGSSASSSDPSLLKQSQQISDRLAAEAAARAVQQDMAQKRAQQCKQAQDAYQKAINARYIYRVGADGQREVLNDQEADQQRVADRLAMDSACQGS